MKRCNSMLHLAPAYIIHHWKMGEYTFFFIDIILLRSSQLKNLSRTSHTTSDLHRHQHWPVTQCVHNVCIHDAKRHSTLFIEVNFIEIFDTFQHYPEIAYDKRKKHILEIYSRDDHVLERVLCVECLKLLLFEWIETTHELYPTPSCMHAAHFNKREKNAFCEMRNATRQPYEPINW